MSLRLRWKPLFPLRQLPDVTLKEKTVTLVEITSVLLNGGLDAFVIKLCGCSRGSTAALRGIVCH